MYKIIALIGEAGSGKDTILKKLIEGTDCLSPIISCTTRPPREYEKNSIDYYFLTKEEFADHVLNNDFLEVSEFNNWFYGTLKQNLRKDKINIAVLNPEGIEHILLHNDIKLKVYYISTPSKIRIIRQLQREDNPNISEIFRRWKTDDEDFFYLPFDYDTLINNNYNDLFDCVNKISAFARHWTEEDKE